jgi:glycosyltransferase involved in cell wall biosynthesis/GT2 family glycosyltransferase
MLEAVRTLHEEQSRAVTADPSQPLPDGPVAPIVRIGIVTWNSERFIGPCLDSLAAALGRFESDVEIVVVDNNSSDRSADVAAEHGASVVRFSANAGYARAMNEALDGTRAPFVVALNPDTIATEGSLEALISRLERERDIAIVAPRLAHPGGRTQYSAHRFPSVGVAAITGFVPLRFRRGRLGDRWLLDGFCDERHHRVSDVDWVIGAVHAMRRSLVGDRPYDERYFMYVEDLALCHEMHKRGARVVLDGTVTVEHAGNASGSVAFGARRETRWLDAMYDWFAREHGPARSRLWAATNAAGHGLKLIVLRALQVFRGRNHYEAKAQSRRRLARYHAGKLFTVPTRDRSTLRADPAARRVIGVVAGGMVSGAERVLLRDLVAARRQGWAVQLASGDGPLIEQCTSAGIEVVRIPDLRLPRLPRPVAFAIALGRACRAAVRIRSTITPETVVVVNSVNALTVVRMLRPTTPIVYFAHDVLVRTDRRLLLRLTAPRIDMAIAVSEWVAKRLRVLGVPTEVVYNGTEYPVPPAQPDRDPRVIGIAALLTPWKGHEVLLDAFARLESTDVVLEIMGGAPANDERYAQALQVRSARLGIADRVRFLGHRDDPLATMRRWSIAISASTDPEAGPLVGLEAMSLGLPMIATDHGGVTEVLGPAGVLVPPADPIALARAIDAMLADEGTMQRHGSVGPEIVRSRGFTLEAQSTHWLAVLESVASGHAQS